MNMNNNGSGTYMWRRNEVNRDRLMNLFLCVFFERKGTVLLIGTAVDTG